MKLLHATVHSVGWIARIVLTQGPYALPSSVVRYWKSREATAGVEREERGKEEEEEFVFCLPEHRVCCSMLLFLTGLALLEKQAGCVLRSMYVYEQCRCFVVKRGTLRFLSQLLIVQIRAKGGPHVSPVDRYFTC